MQLQSGHYLMRQQVPLVLLLLLVNVSAVDCTSEDIKLGSCWRKDILTVQRSSNNHKMLLF